jgi:2,4'-dihydroxyacetophenone dioxygenase
MVMADWKGEQKMTALTALETLYESGAETPEVPFTPYNEDVKIKLLRVDPLRGQMCLVLSAPGGTGLGVHKHYGYVIVYTLRGAWRYLEHDWISRAGDFVYETAGSTHTFVADEDTEAFIVLEGALEFLDEDGNRLAIEDWQSMYRRYLDYCRAQGIEAPDLKTFDTVEVT